MVYLNYGETVLGPPPISRTSTVSYDLSPLPRFYSLLSLFYSGVCLSVCRVAKLGFGTWMANFCFFFYHHLHQSVYCRNRTGLKPDRHLRLTRHQLHIYLTSLEATSMCNATLDTTQHNTTRLFQFSLLKFGQGL